MNNGNPNPTHRPITFIAAAAAAVLVTAASGVVSGRLTGRWGEPDLMRATAEEIKNFPTNVGPWRFQAELELDEQAEEQLQCIGYRHGTYLNLDTGESVLVSLIVGPFGPMSVHNPDVCYPAAGYKRLRTPQRQLITSQDGGPRGEFWSSVFESKAIGGLPLHVYYAWYKAGNWRAPDWPRFALGGAPALVKIQVASEYEDRRTDQRDAPCTQFLRDFMPVWNQSAKASGLAENS